MEVNLADLDEQQLHTAESAARVVGVDGRRFRRYALALVSGAPEWRPGQHVYTTAQVRQVAEAINKGVLVELGNQKRSATMKRIAAQRAQLRGRKTTK